MLRLVVFIYFSINYIIRHILNQIFNSVSRHGLFVLFCVFCTVERCGHINEEKFVVA